MSNPTVQPAPRDIDTIISRVRELLPHIQISQLWVKYPGVDDDGLWFFESPGKKKNMQLESSSGSCPFIIETNDMTSSAQALRAFTIDDAIRYILDYFRATK